MILWWRLEIEHENDDEDENDFGDRQSDANFYIWAIRGLKSHEIIAQALAWVAQALAWVLIY